MMLLVSWLMMLEKSISGMYIESGNSISDFAMLPQIVGTEFPRSLLLPLAFAKYFLVKRSFLFIL